VNDESLAEVQIKIAFLERANSDLSDVVLRQQREIQWLSSRIKEVADRLEAVQSDARHDPSDDERPPHY
jgi:SlyX protein